MTIRLLIAAFLTFSLLSSFALASTWTRTTIDTGDMYTGTHNSIAVDVSPWNYAIYITYIYYDSIKCAANYGYGWQKTIVETTDGSHGMIYGDTSVDAISSGGESSVAVCYSLNEGLKCATYYYGWHSTLVDVATRYCDIALDGAFYPHISYYFGDSDLKYAYADGSGWHTTVVDDVGNVGTYNSIAIDGSNRPHISYGDETMPTTNYKLKYAYYDGGAWQIQVVTDDFNGWGTSIAVDSNNMPHISYCGGEPSFHLMHAYYDGISWQTETVDSSGNVGMWYSSIALDSLDRPHISYYDYDHQTLKYAFYDGAAWQLETVDNTYGTGKFNCLALDPSGNAHISYSGTLNYATTATQPPTPLVGGKYISPNKLVLTAPYIALFTTILVATGVATLYVRHRPARALARTVRAECTKQRKEGKRNCPD